MKIGTIKIDKSIMLAPMEDVTDSPFRQICKKMGADVVFTEFTSSEAIIRDIPRAIQKIEFEEIERPIAIQIFGGVAASMEGAARRAEQLKPDFIDINCGCWVKNHVARGEGAGLLKDLVHFEKIVKSTVRATKLPVTVKTRLGWDEQNIVIVDVAKMVEQAGAKALTVHCRTRSQAHKGDADWSWLERIKAAVNIPIIGNGDVREPVDVKRMLETGCDGVMIGRGAIQNPWIFRQAKHFLKAGTHLPGPGVKERIDLCIEHLQLSAKIKGIGKSILPFRKYYIGYLKGLPNVSELRSDLMQLTELKKIINRLYQFLEQNRHYAVHNA